MNASIVTGAARGIGRAIAERLAGEGHALVLVDVAPEVAEVAAALGPPAVAVEADLTDPAGRERVLTAVRAGGSTPAVLVNCAGITRDARVVNMSDEDFSRVLEVNVGAAYELTRMVAPHMGAGSAIVNIASRAYLGNFGQFNYSMSKGALVGMTRALALGYAPRIRVNAIAPGLIATEMVMTIPENLRSRMIDAVPLRRMGSPAEVAEAALFLCSDRSSYVTGHVLVVGGGRSLSR